MKYWMRVIILSGQSRPPHGGRGLKFGMQDVSWELVKSPPTRGAWIEMANPVTWIVIGIVAPHTGGVD